MREQIAAVRRVLRAVEELSPCCPVCGQNFEEHLRGCEFAQLKEFADPRPLPNPDLLEEASRRG